MKKIILMLWMVIISISGTAGCRTVKEQKIPDPDQNKLDKHIKEERMQEKDAEKLIKKNTETLLSYLDISKYGAEGCCQMLHMVGCRELVELEITDKEECYSLTLTDTEDKKYYITLSYEGYLGVIQDESGEYLYAPVD